MESLANKYRPYKFDEVLGQSSIIKILEQQIKSKSHKNCYIFSGPSGDGKTTVARIFAYELNKYFDSNGNLCSSEPIEIDGASNNGVDNIRLITDSAKERSLDGRYKVFIIDECHMITNAGWNAFLKCIEEPPKYTIFIFCTTELNKIPQTIVNRCQVHRFSKVDNKLIINRLVHICDLEGFYHTEEALDYITKLSNGSVRQAISYLDKCKDYSTNITINNVCAVLGDYSYDIMLNLTNSIIDNNKQNIIDIIDKLYFNGNDLKLFMDNYVQFVLDLTKFCIFKTLDVTSIPEELLEKVKYTTGIENNTKWFNSFVDKLLNVRFKLTGDSSPKTTLEIMLLSILN